MKVRKDFVTNSSSASYIICFARIANKEKANEIINKHNLTLWTKKEIEEQYKSFWGDCLSLGAEWAGAEIYNAQDILNQYPADSFIIIEDRIDADYDYDSDEYIFYYNFYMHNVIEDITEENGFDNIEIAEGEGRDG